MVYKFFGEKSASDADKPDFCSGIKNENESNEELAEELHKPIIKKFKKEKYTHLLYTICWVLI